MRAEEQQPEVERQSMEVDIACVGFGPAMGGFLSSLAAKLVNEDGTPLAESKAMPGMPLQVICYERADDVAFGVSGVVTKARGIRESFPELDASQIPMAAPVTSEKVLYMLDPVGASRRSATLRLADKLIRTFKTVLPVEHGALELPYTPSFLNKHGGMLLSIGQFNQWVGSQLMTSGSVQIWPGMPVAKPLIKNHHVVGVRLVDQGVDKSGSPEASFMAGMDIKAALTVIGDGPVGAVGRDIDAHFGMPAGHHTRDWAVGTKMVIDLPEHVDLAPGTVFHTFGYPEPEIFGFMYVHPDRVASIGIFVPSWFDNPVRTSYRYLQHYMMHPYFWRYLEGGTLRSWGAKSLQESGKRGEPRLVGHGFARIGEGSGSTNVLTGSGVDEAWTTGTLLAEGVVELLKDGKPFSRENLEKAYVERRRKSWVEKEGRVAEHARDGFQRGVVSGLIGMALAGMTGGKVTLDAEPKLPHERIKSAERYFAGKLTAGEIDEIKRDCTARNASLHDALMDRCGWPAIPYDGKLLITHQDALLVGGKVQAPAGYADHVVIVQPEVCKTCGSKTCIEICSGEAITPGEEGVPGFDREKCVYCGACLWNCSQEIERGKTNIEFKAGAGGLHSAQN
ncbi:MAG TPA: 4Fe-4S ferredoxin [Clostridia bacterium]|nr:4Fe-4S ferredoxin [Clostridia bacterium]